MPNMKALTTLFFLSWEGLHCLLGLGINMTKLNYLFQLDFYIDNDMIHIADTKVAHRFGDFFIRKLLKFEELNRKLHHIKI